jgi:hypothetical protein
VRANDLTRSRKFNPQTLFVSVLHLASSTNKDGYLTSLRRTWENFGFKGSQTPSVSSLSEYREKVRFDFFKDIFENDLEQFEPSRKMFRGHYVYAIDGDQLDLPSSPNVLAKGYRGKKHSKVYETHYPKLYTVQLVDLINGTTNGFECSTRYGEQSLAQKIIPNLEANSITLYDRNFDSYRMAIAHEGAGNYFLVRVKANNPRLNLEVQDFCRSRRRSKWITMHPPYGQTGWPIRLRLVKVWNPKTKIHLVFMTNLPEGLIRRKEAGALYQRRWGIESSFKDMTDTLKLGQWHSTKVNGIFQEIYALLWLANNVKRLCAGASRARDFLKPQYQKANFKHAVGVLVDHLDLLVRRKYRKLRRILHLWIIRTTARREHLSRSYPRQVKRHGKKYTNASRVGLRPTVGA